MADIVETQFRIDHENSVDRRATLEPDRFGYLSLHYIVQVDDNRGGLVEYRRFRDIRFEIQIRSILQHAWAEMEHDLGYKSEQAVPRPIRRRFSRLAGLLEMGDEEFVQLRDQLQEYSEAVGSAIQGQSETVFIDKDSMRALIESNDLIHQLDQAIVDSVNGELIEAPRSLGEDQASRYSERLQSLGLRTIADVEQDLNDYKDLIARFAERWLKQQEDSPGMFLSGISIFYLMYILVLSTRDPDRINAYLRMAIPEAKTNPEPLRRKLQAIYKELTQPVSDK